VSKHASVNRLHLTGQREKINSRDIDFLSLTMRDCSLFTRACSITAYTALWAIFIYTIFDYIT